MPGGSGRLYVQVDTLDRPSRALGPAVSVGDLAPAISVGTPPSCREALQRRVSLAPPDLLGQPAAIELGDQLDQFLTQAVRHRMAVHRLTDRNHLDATSPEQALLDGAVLAVPGEAGELPDHDDVGEARCVLGSGSPGRLPLVVIALESSLTSSYL